MTNASGNWSSISDLRVNEIEGYAQDMVNALYSQLMKQAQRAEVLGPNGKVEWSAVPWATAAQELASQQLLRFTNALRETGKGKESWATNMMVLPGGVSIFDRSVNSKTWVEEFINRYCTDLYNTDYETLQQLERDKNPVAMMDTVRVTAFLASQTAMELEYKLGSYALFFSKDWLKQSVTLSLIREMRQEMYRKVGTSYDTYDSFSGFADSLWTVLLNKMIVYTNEIVEQGNTDEHVYDSYVPEEDLANYEKIKDVVLTMSKFQMDRGEPAYLPKDAIELHDVGMDCQGVELALGTLNRVNPYIPPVQRGEFESLYKTLATYEDFMCHKDAFVISYEAAFRMTDSFVDDLKGQAEDIWNELLTSDFDINALAVVGGVRMFDQARHKGVLELFNRKLEDAKERVLDAVEALKEDLWSGPAAMRGDGMYVPLNAFGEGSTLYYYWVRNKAITEFYSIYAWLDGQEKVEKEMSGFTLSDDNARVLLAVHYKDDFDPALGGIRTNSVLQEQWANFKAFVISNIGKPFNSSVDFDLLIDGKQRSLIEEGKEQITKMSHNKVMEMPLEFDVYEGKVSSGAVYTMTDHALASDLSMLRRMNMKMPWTYEGRKRFENVYAAYWERINKFSGDVFEIPNSLDVEAFVKQKMDSLETRVAGYRSLLTEVFGSDIELETQLQTFESRILAELAETIGEAKTLVEIHEERMALVSPYEVALQSYLDSIFPRCEEAFDAIIEAVRSAEGKLPTVLEDWATGLLNVKDLRLQDKVAELLELLEKATGYLGGAFLPFMPFTPLKSKGGFAVEEFTVKQVDDLVKVWVEPRLARGIVVEPKIDGYRMALHVRGGEPRIYLEGDVMDVSPAYSDLCAGACKLPDVILDGELVELIDGKVAPRIETGMMSRVKLEHAQPFFYVFDVLYVEGKDVHKLPYKERREMLSELFSRYSIPYVGELPSWYVNTVDGVKQMVEKASQFDGSEGAMLKVVDGEYKFAQETEDWAKVKQMEDVNVVILERDKNKKGMYNYECGVARFSDEGVNKKHVKELKGRSYMVIGRTFNTGEQLSVGDCIEVAVSKIIRYEDDGGYWFEWQDPMVKAQVKRNPDTVEQVEQVGKILGASISHPYRVLMDLYDDSMGSSSIEELEGYENQAYALFNMLNFPRLRRIALMVLTTIEDKITPMGRVSEAGEGEAGEVAGNIANVSMDLVEVLEKKFEGVKNSVDMLASTRSDFAYNLLSGVRQAYALATTEEILVRLASLRERIEAYVKTLEEVEDLSALEIEEKLGALERKVYTALIGDSTDRVKDALEVKEELERLQKENLITSVYSDDITRILEHVDKILQEKKEGLSSLEIQKMINELEQRISEGESNFKHGIDEWAERQIRSAHVDLLNLIDGMTSQQMTAFGHSTDLLLDEIKGIWAEYMPEAHDLGGFYFGGAEFDVYKLMENKMTHTAWENLDSFVHEWLLKTDGVERRKELVREAIAERYDEIKDKSEDEVETFLEEIINGVDRELIAEFEKSFTDDKPRPLGLYESLDDSMWVLKNDKWEAGNNIPGWSSIEDGSRVLISGPRERGLEKWHIEAVRDPDGEVVVGDPEKYREQQTKNAIDSFIRERFPNTLIEDLGEYAVEPYKESIEKGMRGVVDVYGVEGDGGGFFGGYVDGKPFIVTCAHIADSKNNEQDEHGGQNVKVATLDGHLYPGKLLWKGVFNFDPDNYNYEDDIAIYVVDGDFSNMTPLPLAESDGYGVALSSYYGEADMLRKSGGWGWVDYYNEAERSRGGYSGSPIVNSLGQVTGLTNFGGTYGDGNWYRTGGVSAKLLLEAYRAAGIIGGGQRLESGYIGFRRLIMAALSPFAVAPSKIPVEGVLYSIESGKRKDKLLLFDWEGKEDLPITIFIGEEEDEGKLLNYQGGKLVCEVGVIPPGKREKICGVKMLPSRMRPAKDGSFYEFFLNFEGVVALNGLWVISEEAGKECGVPGLLFRLDGLEPFWAREDSRHGNERAVMAKWQKPSGADVRNFFKDGG